MKNILCFLLCFCGLFLSPVQAQQAPVAAEKVSPEKALERYLNKANKTYHWKVHDEYTDGNLQVYNLLLTSQHWMEFDWTHQLSILVPEGVQEKGALLFITGEALKTDCQIGTKINRTSNWCS